MMFESALADRNTVLSRLSAEGIDFGLRSAPRQVQRIIARLIAMDHFIPSLLARDGTNVAALANAVTEMTRAYELQKDESARATYRRQLELFYRHHPDPEVDPPPYLPGLTGLADLIEIRYNAFCRVALAQPQVGAWPLVVGDLLDDVGEEDVLLIQSGGDILRDHPATPQVVASASGDSIRRMARSYRATAASIQARQQREIQAGAPGKLIDIIAKVADWALRIAGIYELAEKVYERAKEEQERRRAMEEREREVRDFERGLKPMEGSEKYIDRFEQNRDTISRTC